MGLSQALAYVQRGWSVVPIPRCEKYPAGMSWDQYKTRRAAADEVRGWVKNGGENQNVGIVTGAVSNLVVIDADGKGAIEELARRGISSPLRVQTSKGMHFYFSHPGGEVVKNAVRIWGSKEEGIDIRGDGGLVVAPPSVHNSGRYYTWIGNPSSPLPSYDRDWFSAVGGSVRRPPDWMGQALSGLSTGNRNATFASVAGRLLRDGWTAEAIFSVLTSHAKLVDFPLKELDGVIKSVGRYHPEPAKTSMNAGELLSWDKEIQWIVKGIFPKQASCILGGMQGLGKTWLLIDLAIAVASGEPWLGIFPVTQGPVMYVDEESAPQLMRFRLRKIFNGKSHLNPAKLPVSFRIGAGLNLSDPESRGKFVRELRANPPSLVIIDSLVRAHGVEENSAAEMKLMFAEVKKIADEFGVTFVFADHVHKLAVSTDPRQQREPSSNDLRGSNEKAAFSDTVLSLYRKDGGLVLHHTKSRWAEAVSPFNVLIEDTAPNVTSVRGVRYDSYQSA